MTCHHPLTGYHKVGGGWTANRSQSFTDRGPMIVPCGQCQGCRVDRSAHWRTRIMHEASLYDHNCFITLTYSDKHLPPNGSLDRSHFPSFMKILRQQRRRLQPCPYPKKHPDRKQWLKDNAIRFYQCGEYGPNTGRAHHHAILFNYNFTDRKLFRKSQSDPVFTSELLNQFWPHGENNEIGTVTQASAGYVAGYVNKKLSGQQAEKEYANPETGELREYPYSTMSNRPGIGAPWYDLYKKACYPHDYVVLDGKKRRPPSYYDLLLSREDEKTHRTIKTQRNAAGRLDEWNRTPERLKVREKVQKAKLQQGSYTI